MLMKKIFILASLAALAMPAMQANKVEPTPASRNGAPVIPTALVQNATWGSKTVANKAEAMTWDFESEDQIADWTFIDNDGDGYNWYYHSNAGLTANLMSTHSGDGIMVSASYDNDASAVLTPDNWMISPQVELGGMLSIWAAGQDSNGYDKEVFGVYVCVGTPTGPADFQQVGSDITTAHDFAEFLFNLSAYAGQTGCFAIVHHNVSDQFLLNIDDITLDPNYVVLDAPIELAATPGVTDASIAWTDPNSGVETWNLRYMEYDPNVVVEPVTYSLTESLDPWTVVDADGDGNNWYIDTSVGAACSGSYINGTACSPDNWLISPLVPLGGTLKFDVATHSSYFPETIGVYVYDGEQWTSVSDFKAIEDNLQPTAVYSSAFETWEFDLSEYSGNGYIAIRNYGTYDQWKMYLKNVEITPGVEWIYVKGIDNNPYTLEGLTAETNYVVQVQSVSGDYTGPWSDQLIFTTLAEGQQPTETKYYVTGGFNGWNAETPEEIGAAGVDITAVADPADEFCLDFKLLTPGENDWIWIGGINENAEQGINYFAITDEMMTTATEIDLYPGEEGWNFRLPAAGTYNISLVKEPIKDPIAGVKMVVTKKTVTGVNDINAKAVAGVKYYNLAGVESNVPFDGVNVVVTTYTDGTKAASKVIK